MSGMGHSFKIVGQEAGRNIYECVCGFPMGCEETEPCPLTINFNKPTPADKVERCDHDGEGFCSMCGTKPTPKSEGPTCGSYPYPVTNCPGGGYFCAGSYFDYKDQASHQSEKMKEAYHQCQQSLKATEHVCKEQHFAKEVLKLQADLAKQKEQEQLWRKEWESISEVAKKQKERLEEIKKQMKLSLSISTDENRNLTLRAYLELMERLEKS